MTSLRHRIVHRLPGIGWRAELLAKREQQVRDLRVREGASRRDVERLEARVSELVAEREQVVSDLRGEVAVAHAAVEAQEGSIAELKERLARQKSFAESAAEAARQPSFLRHLMELRRGVGPLRELDPEGHHPVLQIPRKLRNYRLAASHGIAVPKVFGSWMSPQEIDLKGLPDRFVLKCEIGSSGRGVFPLMRLGDDRFAVIGSDEVHTQESLIERYLAYDGIWGPYFAEEFLTQRVVDQEIPDDIKIYACYGEVVMVLLRQMPRHADLRSARYRYVDAQGRDLGGDVAPDRAVTADIPLPEPFEDFVQTAEHLSRAVALPFIRVDVYDTERGPVLGELTRSPGGSQRYRSDLDLAMGRAWDGAQWRLDLDVIAGRPFRNLHGQHPVPDIYPPTHAANLPNAGSWEMTRVDCEEWCFQGRATGPRLRR